MSFIEGTNGLNVALLKFEGVEHYLLGRSMRLNGNEFYDIKMVAEKLKIDIYSATPYSSWARGLNENFNGLLRQYIRKGTNLQTITDKQIAEVEKALNARPRKCLGFKQSIAVFNELRKVA
nr:IS30 family transposase [Alteromonas portus]